MTIAAILKHKGTDIAHVAPSDSVIAVTRLLGERRIGAVLVRDAAGQLLGIVSERDIVRRLATAGEETLRMTAAQLMTAVLYTATPATTEVQALEMMTHRRVRHLPVLDDGKLVGVVSIGDVVKMRLTQQDAEVDSLKAYVSGVG